MRVEGPLLWAVGDTLPSYRHLTGPVLQPGIGQFCNLSSRVMLLGMVLCWGEGNHIRRSMSLCAGGISSESRCIAPHRFHSELGEAWLCSKNCLKPHGIRRAHGMLVGWDRLTGRQYIVLGMRRSRNDNPYGPVLSLCALHVVALI